MVKYQLRSQADDEKVTITVTINHCPNDHPGIVTWHISEVYSNSCLRQLQSTGGAEQINIGFTTSMLSWQLPLRRRRKKVIITVLTSF